MKESLLNLKSKNYVIFTGKFGFGILQYLRKEFYSHY